MIPIVQRLIVKNGFGFSIADSLKSSFKLQVGYLLKDPVFSQHTTVHNHANAGDTVEDDLEGQLTAFSSTHTGATTVPTYDAIHGACLLVYA